MSTATETGFAITNITPDVRYGIALAALRYRLSIAIRFGNTDTVALHSARRWAELSGYAGKTRTMVQCLAYVEAAQAAQDAE